MRSPSTDNAQRVPGETPPRLAIVIPVWNRKVMVLDTLGSVLAQTHTPDRVVIVDDGSTDGTPESVDRWMSTHSVPRSWELIEERHRGASAARNTGLASIGDCERVAFLDSDDLWPTDLVARANEAFTRNPDLVGASSDRLMADGKSNTTDRHDLSRLAKDPLSWAILHGSGLGSCSVISARAVRAVGGYPVEIVSGHDIVMFTRLFDLGPWGHLPGDPVTFRRNQAHRYNEADHIFRSVKGVNADWAAQFDTVYESLRQSNRASLKVRRAMARRWLSAAKDSYRGGEIETGRDQLRRSRGYWPCSLRHLKWSLRYAMKGNA